jgi:hypothetical protein
MRIPKSHYIYEFSYPEQMPGFPGGTVFYVGKGTSLSRMDSHFTEAAGGCDCDKCKAIRSIWNAGLVVVRRIVFETTSEREAVEEEKVRIARHRSPYFTNVQGGCGTRRAAKVEKDDKQVSVLYWMQQQKIIVGLYEFAKLCGVINNVDRFYHAIDHSGIRYERIDGYSQYYAEDAPSFRKFLEEKYPEVFDKNPYPAPKRYITCEPTMEPRSRYRR